MLGDVLACVMLYRWISVLQQALLNSDCYLLAHTWNVSYSPLRKGTGSEKEDGLLMPIFSFRSSFGSGHRMKRDPFRKILNANAAVVH